MINLLYIYNFKFTDVMHLYFTTTSSHICQFYQYEIPDILSMTKFRHDKSGGIILLTENNFPKND